MSTKRSPERQQLAAAIRERDEAEQQAACLKQAQNRSAADLFLARRDVEAAEAALKRPPDTDALVEAYMNGREPDRSVMRAAEAELDRARSRLADMETIAAALRDTPVYDENWRVREAVRAVVSADPAVRRVVLDYDKTKKYFRVIHATARWLIQQNMVPEDLKTLAPGAGEVYFGAPDPAWLSAIERLASDADATLPE